MNPQSFLIHLKYKMRVVVTGMGVVSPLGNTLAEYWSKLCSGTSGISTITEFDTSTSSCKIAATVKGFEPLDWFKKRQIKTMDRFSQIGVAAAAIAWNDAGLEGHTTAPERTAVIAGTGIGGISSYKDAYDALYKEAAERKVNAYTIPRIMHNALSSGIGIYLNIKGRNIAVNTACSSGANAIGHAFEWVRSGKVDWVLCGGSEAPVTYEMLKTWNALGVLSRSNDPASAACKPFDKNRDGFVLSEGAGIVVLESLDFALRRDAKIYAELKGYGSNCDAMSLTSPTEKGVAQSMRYALLDAQIAPEQVDMINAHGTATRVNDPIETAAIHDIFGDHAHKLAVTANKSMLGHSMGASSALELVSTVLSVKNDLIPPTANHTRPDAKCDLNYVPHSALKQKVDCAISNSFAFGGSNAVLVVNKWER